MIPPRSYFRDGGDKVRLWKALGEPGRCWEALERTAVAPYVPKKLLINRPSDNLVKLLLNYNIATF